jgi:hypothetical protein
LNSNKPLTSKIKEMKRILLAAVVVPSLLFSSCRKEVLRGEGPVVTETRTIGNFRGVSSSIPGTVNFKVDPVYKVEIQAQQNILDALRTNVTGGKLEIDFKHYIVVRHHESIVINISAPSPDYLRVSGVGDINVTGDLVATNLDANVSGVGSIVVQKATVTGKIDARISGSGNIRIAAGAAENEELHISGSGSIDLAGVVAKKAETHISGSGDMKVNLSQNLDAHISGSGSVLYRGNPLVTTHVSGSGKVKPL